MITLYQIAVWYPVSRVLLLAKMFLNFYFIFSIFEIAYKSCQYGSSYTNFFLTLLEYFYDIAYQRFFFKMDDDSTLILTIFDTTGANTLYLFLRSLDRMPSTLADLFSLSELRVFSICLALTSSKSLSTLMLICSQDYSGVLTCNIFS